MSFGELQQKIAQQWHSLDAAEKAKFATQSLQDKQRYDSEYQQYELDTLKFGFGSWSNTVEENDAFAEFVAKKTCFGLRKVVDFV